MNTIKIQKYIKNKNHNIIENRFALLFEKLKLIENKIKRNTFGGKVRYIIPVFIIKSNSSNEFIINISIKHTLLERNKDHYAYYFLLKLCDEKIWKEIALN